MFEQELIELGYKILKKQDIVEMDFETEVLNGFKLVGSTYLYDEDEDLGTELGIQVTLWIQNEEFSDFEEYGTLYREFFHNAKKVLPKLKSLTDNFKKYCGNSPKQAIEYNFEELMALDEKITGNTYKSIKI